MYDFKSNVQCFHRQGLIDSWACQKQKLEADLAFARELIKAFESKVETMKFFGDELARMAKHYPVPLAADQAIENWNKSK